MKPASKRAAGFDPRHPAFHAAEAWVWSRGDVGDQLALRAGTWVGFQAVLLLTLQPLRTLGVFLIGARLWRGGLFRDEGARLRRGLIRYPLVLGLGAETLVVGLHLVSGFDEAHPLAIVAESVHGLSGLAVGVGLAGALAAVAMHRSVGRWLAPMAHVGRMALSCYLGQSIAGLVLVGLIGFGALHRAWHLPVALGVVAVQLAVRMADSHDSLVLHSDLTAQSPPLEVVVKKLLFAALAAAPSPAVADELAGLLDEIAAHATAPLPALSSADRRRLASGGTVTASGWFDGAYRVSGVRLVDAPRDQVWAAVHDPAVVGDPSVKEVRLSASNDGTELWYGRMILPMGLSDRHWVVRSRIHRALSDATEGRAWERAWTELDDGLPLALPALAAGHLPGFDAGSLQTAIVTPTNRGAWLVVRLADGRTLLATHATTDLGGSVPAWMVRDVARRQVADVLARVARASGRPHPEVISGG